MIDPSLIIASTLVSAVQSGLRSRNAREDLAWRRSSEYKEFARLRLWVWIGTAVAVTVLAILYYQIVSRYFELRQNPLLLVWIVPGSAAVALVVGFSLALHRSRLERVVLIADAESLVRELQQDDRKAEDGDGTDLDSLWRSTQRRIELYHSIATSQAQSSFIIGQRATVAGFAAVLTLGVIAAFADSGTGAIAAGVVGVAGAAMSGYVGATFMKAQAEASAQLQQFFLQPVELLRVLSAERLINRLTDNKGAEGELLRIAIQSILLQRDSKLSSGPAASTGTPTGVSGNL